MASLIKFIEEIPISTVGISPYIQIPEISTTTPIVFEDVTHIH